MFWYEWARPQPSCRLNAIGQVQQLIHPFLSVIVMGIAQMNTEEVQIVRNQIYAAEALAIADAGLNYVLAQLRVDSGWDNDLTDVSFSGGSYSLTVNNNYPNVTIESEATSSQGFVARVAADATMSSSGPPYVIRIDNLRINE